MNSAATSFRSTRCSPSSTTIKNIFYLDFGSQFIEDDGSISKSIMPDALHPNAAGYRIWANATEPKLKQLLGE